MLDEILSRRAGGADGARRRDVVGGDRVEKQRQDAGVVDILDRRRRPRQAVEIGRVLDVGRAGVPGVGEAGGNLDLAPVRLAVEHARVFGLEHLGGDGGLDELLNLVRRRPDVGEIDRLALPVGAKRLAGQIDEHRACERVSHDERWRGEVVGPGVGIDAALEVAVSRENRGGDQIAPGDRRRDLARERARIADAGGAAETDDVEAELVERLLQLGLLEIVLNDLAARRERGLHPRLDGKALGDGVARQKARGDHHARIRGVGAGGDGGDDDVAIAEIEIRSLDLVPHGDIFALLELACHRPDEAGLGAAENDPILRALGAGERGRDLAEVELQRVAEDRIGGEPGAIGALRLRVGLDQGDARGFAPGGLEIAKRLRVDGKEAAGRAIFRSHVGERGAVGDRHGVEAGAEKFDEFADDALLAQHLGDGQNEIGRGHPLAQFALQPESDHLGQQHRQRLSEHRRFRLDSPDAPAEHGQAVDHGGVAVGADQRVGIGDLDGFAVALFLRGPDGLREIFEIDLMADAGAGRHHREVGEGLLAPLQEAIALLVLLVFARHILRHRPGRAEMIDDDRMVDDQVDWNQGIDLVGVAAELLHRVAHGGEIDDRRHAGEVLHQHARRAEGDFVLLPASIVGPGGDRFDVFLGDATPVLVAQQIFEDDLQRERQFRDPGKAVLLRGLERKDLVCPRPDRQRLAAFETVEAGHASAPKTRLGKDGPLIDNISRAGYTNYGLDRGRAGAARMKGTRCAFARRA